MVLQTAQPRHHDRHHSVSDRTQDAAPSHLWQWLLIVGSVFTVSIAIVPCPVQAQERSPISTPAASINANFEPLPESSSSEVSSDQPATLLLTERPVYSTQAKDLLGQTTPDATVETPTNQTNPTESKDNAQSSVPQPANPFSDRLTGDWGGFRSTLAKHGVTLDVEFTQFYQGLVSGTGTEVFKEGAQFKFVEETGGYGGKLDTFIGLDFGKLGLWKGGGLQTHLEYRFGSLAGGLGNTFFPTNAAMEFPGESPDTLVASSLYLTQQFGDRVSLLLGKINALDLLKNDLFFGGWGIHRFQNVVFAAPPSGLVPVVFYGAIANVRLDPVTVSFWVYDPVDRTREYWPDDLFASGVTFSLTTSYATKIAGRPTTFSLTGIYSTKTGTDFSSVSEAFRSRLQPLTKTGTYNIAFQFSHLLHQNPSNPKQGWGLFFKGAISDGNPNYVQSSIIAGLGGTGLFRGRELDSFGVGYYYYNLSDALQDSLNDIFRRVSFGDEQGIEVYYSYAITPWFYFTADFQYIRPPRSSFEDAFVAGVRANIRF